VVVSPGSGGNKQPRPGDWSRVLREAAPYLGLGTTLAGSLLLGVGAGYWLDRRLGTSPWLLLAGALLGIFSGLFQLYKTMAGGKKQ